MTDGEAAPRRPRVLIADDDERLGELFAEYLRPAYDVEVSRGGILALAAAVLRPPDVVILDLNMPDMHGLEVLERLHFLLPAVHVIVVTGEAELALAEASLQGGAFSYVPKPVDLRYLQHLVATVLASRAQPPA